MIGSGEHFRVTRRGVPLQSVLPNLTRKVPDLMSIAKD
jgi:hypothetical protein